MQAPSLTFALQQPKIMCNGIAGDGMPYTDVATPSRAYTHSPMHGTGITPVASPAHRGFGQATAVSVIAPGGGTGINGAVYAEVGQDPQFTIDYVGRSRAPYDCYPEYWPNGEPAPNLHSFAEDVLRHGWVEKTDLFVFGSRGGQVVLPALWHYKGDRMPPAVCINGGCAMKLPRAVRWPDAAITFLLIGGEDYFRGNISVEEYMAETKAQVPPSNGTTAILFVREMQHMPQQALLRVVLPLMLRAISNWQQFGRAPRDELRLILSAVNRDGWSGRLMYTVGPGQWAPDVDFGPFHVAQHVPCAADALHGAHAHDAGPIELSRGEELKVLFKAAALAAQPGGGAPLAHAGDRLHALVQAAAKSQQASASSPALPHGETPKKRLTLPISLAGSPEPGRSRTRTESLNGLSGLSPCSQGARTPKTPNRLMPPRPDARYEAAPTPISRALGMPPQFYPSPSHSSSHSHASTPSGAVSPFSACSGYYDHSLAGHFPPPVMVRN